MPWVVTGNIRGPQGPQGPQGIQGTPGPAGPAGLEWRGLWDDATDYAPNDAVSWGGSSYFALDAPEPAVGTPPTGTSADPGADDSDVNAGWALLSSQGAPGPQGAQGVQGDEGPQGPAGPTGTRGTQWYTGTGAPGVIAGSLPGDKYLDTSNGDVYELS